MKRLRVGLTLLFGATLLTIGAVLGYRANLFGFPDGHLSDYERFMRPVLLTAAAGYVGLAFWMAVRLLTGGNAQRRNLFIALGAGILLLGVNAAALMLLENGQGG